MWEVNVRDHLILMQEVFKMGVYEIDTFEEEVGYVVSFLLV